MGLMRAKRPHGLCPAEAVSLRFGSRTVEKREQVAHAGEDERPRVNAGLIAMTLPLLV
jgi:hypothetical protein